MPKKKKTKPKEKSQRRRFIDFAKEQGADDDGSALERVFEKATKPARATKKPKHEDA